jgi:hypothetical protein
VIILNDELEMRGSLPVLRYFPSIHLEGLRIHIGIAVEVNGMVQASAVLSSATGGEVEWAPEPVGRCSPVSRFSFQASNSKLK